MKEETLQRKLQKCIESQEPTINNYIPTHGRTGKIPRKVQPTKTKSRRKRKYE